MPIVTYNRTVTQVPITQGGAGALDIVAAPGVGLKVYVTQFFVILDAAGSVTFNEGTGPTALTGVMPIAINGFIGRGDGTSVILQTNTANAKLTMTSVTGKMFGWLTYFVDA
jgi:hypothetical protein